LQPLRITPYDEVTIATALGWQKKNDKWVITERAILLEDDSNISLEEAYANAMEMYVADPVRLKARAEGIYKWIIIEYGDKMK
jgi:hypothetical protein